MKLSEYNLIVIVRTSISLSSSVIPLPSNNPDTDSQRPTNVTMSQIQQPEKRKSFFSQIFSSAASALMPQQKEAVVPLSSIQSGSNNIRFNQSEQATADENFRESKPPQNELFEGLSTVMKEPNTISAIKANVDIETEVIYYHYLKT
jgi:hypothetical protein